MVSFSFGFSRSIQTLEMAASARVPNEGMMQDARVFIERCKSELNWEDLSNDTVMDVGCGYFFYSTRALLEKFENIECLIAIDKTPSIMNRGLSAVNEQIYENLLETECFQFHVIDILNSEFFHENGGLLDKIVCRNTLQQISDKDIAFRNMYAALKPGGHAAILFCLTNPVGIWQSTMTASENWRQYRKNVPPLFFPGNMEDDFYKNLLEDIGFQVVKCERIDVRLQFSSEQHCLRELLLFGRAILDIPQERMVEFKEDSLRVFKDLIGYSGSGRLRYETSDLLLLAIKPS